MAHVVELNQNVPWSKKRQEKAPFTHISQWHIGEYCRMLSLTFCRWVLTPTQRLQKFENSKNSDVFFSRIQYSEQNKESTQFFGKVFREKLQSCFNNKKPHKETQCEGEKKCSAFFHSDILNASNIMHWFLSCLTLQIVHYIILHLWFWTLII